MAKVQTSKKPRFDIDQYLVDSKNRAYFVGLVTVVSIVLIIVGGVMPAYSAVLSQDRENKKRDEVIGLLDTKLNSLKSMIEEEGTDNVQINALDASIPDSSPQAEVIKEINKFTKDLNVKLNTVSFAKSSRVNPVSIELVLDRRIQSQEASLGIEGSLDSIKSLLKEFENSKRIYNLRSITFERKSATDITFKEGFEYQATVNVEFFWWDNSISSI